MFLCLIKIESYDRNCFERFLRKFKINFLALNKSAIIFFYILNNYYNFPQRITNKKMVTNKTGIKLFLT